MAPRVTMLGSPSTHISPHLPAAMRAIFSFVVAVRWPQHRKPDQSCTKRHALVLRTRAPVGEEGEEVGDGADTHTAVAVEVGWDRRGRCPRPLAAPADRECRRCRRLANRPMDEVRTVQQHLFIRPFEKRAEAEL